MPVFSYKAKTPDGRTIEGTMDADNDQVLLARLKSQKLQVLHTQRMGQGVSNLFKTGPKVKTEQIAIFSRQFSTMITAGLPVLQALNILVEQSDDKVLKDLLGKIRDDIGSGGNLSDAMAKYPTVFDNLYCNMIKAGELSGALDQILDRLSTFLEKQEALKSKIKGAMSYPVTIMIIASIIIIFLMVKVVPSFTAVFDSFGGELPGLTKSLIAFSDFEQKFAGVQVGAIGLIVLIVNIMKRTDQGAMMLDKLTMKMPLFGDLTKKSAVARFASTLGTLLKSGVQILDALETVARSAGNKVVEKALLDTRAAVREGQSLTDPLKACGLFPSMVIQMVSVGEETGQLDEMLLRMSTFYSNEVDGAVDSLMAMMEPLIMSVIGVFVGWLVIGMFMPMMSMSQMVH